MHLQRKAFHGVMHEGAFLPTLLCSQNNATNQTLYYYLRWLNLLRLALFFVYKVYIGFFSHMRDSAVTIA
jgi:hypothetical protein